MRFLAWLLLLLPSIANAQTVRINLESVASGLTGPLYITHAHDATNRRFIVEQPGRVSVMQPNSAPTTMLDIRSRVLSGGERGLLGLAFHPQFASNGRFLMGTQTVKPLHLTSRRQLMSNQLHCLVIWRLQFDRTKSAICRPITLPRLR